MPTHDAAISLRTLDGLRLAGTLTARRIMLRRRALPAATRCKITWWLRWAWVPVGLVAYGGWGPSGRSTCWLGLTPI